GLGHALVPAERAAAHVDGLEAGFLGEPRHDRIERHRCDNEVIAADEFAELLHPGLLAYCDRSSMIRSKHKGRKAMHAARAVSSRLAQLTTGAVAFALIAAASPASAETYPTRPVTIITPFAAGSQTDAAARLLGQYLQEALGQSFVIDNRAGAG